MNENIGKISDLEQYQRRKTETVLSGFSESYNCAQSVLCAFHDEIGQNKAEN